MKRAMYAVSLVVLLAIGGLIAKGRSEAKPAPGVLPTGRTVAAAEPNPPIGTAAESNDDWQMFRSTFPLHMQTIAVARNNVSKARTLILSEPPPHVTVDGVKAVSPLLLNSAEVKQWAIGFDGWVKDIVIRLPSLDDQALTDLRDRLSEYLFATKYKAYMLELPVNEVSLKTQYPLDLHVSTADLDRWYDTLTFRPLETGATMSFLLKDAARGVYISTEPGLVAWVMPKSGLETEQANCRRFAMDSDVILGAVGRSDTVVVLARERVASLISMPPLRAETVRDLASAQTDELAQSYERLLFGAGRTEFGWDWAPCYLSDLLLDTEYGSLLNQTDQMLKGWSECNLVQYHRFPYSPPGRMPFDNGLMRQLHAETLTYNWNTSGFGIMSHSGERTVYCNTRTGALPVTYLTSETEDDAPASVLQAQEDAYSYYAGLNDPLLARVVQYATLYQIFQNVKVTASVRATPHWDQSAAVQGLVKVVLTHLVGMTEEQIDDGAKKFGAHVRVVAQAETDAKQDELGLLEQLAAAHFGTVIRDYQDFHKDHGSDGDERLVRLLGRSHDSDFEQLRREYDDTLGEIAAGMSSIELESLTNVGELQQRFSSSRNDQTTGWIRTPTVVFSRGADVNAVGGHNLDAKVPEIIRDATMAPGKVRLDLLNRPVCHPDTALVLEAASRKLMAAKSPAELLQIAESLAMKAAPSPRSLSSALARGVEEAHGTRGAGAAHLPGGGGKPPTKIVNGTVGSLPDAGVPRPTGTYVVAEGDSEVLRLSPKDDLIIVERVRNGKVISSQRVWSRRALSSMLLSEARNSNRSLDKGMLVLEVGDGLDIRHMVANMVLENSRPLPGGARVICRAGSEDVAASRLTTVKDLQITSVTERGSDTSVVVVEFRLGRAKVEIASPVCSPKEAVTETTASVVVNKALSDATNMSLIEAESLLQNRLRERFKSLDDAQGVIGIDIEIGHTRRNGTDDGMPFQVRVAALTGGRP